MKCVKSVYVLLCLLLGFGLVGCGDWSEIPDETFYADVTATSKIPDASKKLWKRAKLTVDRSKKMLTLVLPDGVKHSLQFELVKRGNWSEQCPGNLSSTQVEFFRLTKKKLEIGGVTFNKPVLLGECSYEGPKGENPDHVYLTEEQSLGFSKKNPTIDFRTKIDCVPTKAPCN